MKTLPGDGFQSSLRPRKKKQSRKALPDEVHEITHQLLNQLSVINLCSFKVKSTLRGGGDPVLGGDLDLLERAIEGATGSAERLSQVITDLTPVAKAKKAAPSRSVEQTGNVVQLFSRQR